MGVDETTQKIYYSSAENSPMERDIYYISLSGKKKKQLTQRYARNTVISATAEEGFQVAEEKSNLDGSIELVVTRWDP